MMIKIQTAAILLLTITGAFAAPAPQDGGDDAPAGPDGPDDTPAASSVAPSSVATTSVAAAATSIATSSTVVVAAASTSDATATPAAATPAAFSGPSSATTLPHSVFDRVNFDPALTKLSSGQTARVVRKYGPSFEAASANLFYIPSSATGTCTLNFQFRSSTGATISGAGRSNVFFCNPVYNAAGSVSACTRDREFGTIQAKLDGKTYFVPGQGPATGTFPCSAYAGKTVGIDMAAVYDVDYIYWKVASGDGPSISYSY